VTFKTGFRSSKDCQISRYEDKLNSNYLAKIHSKLERRKKI